jgi:hypothetical protein
MEIFDMKAKKNPIVVSEKLGKHLLRHNNYNNGGRYLTIEEAKRYLVPVVKESTPQPTVLIEKIEVKPIEAVKETVSFEEVVLTVTDFKDYWATREGMTAIARREAISNNVNPELVTATGNNGSITTADIRRAIQ